MSNSNSKNKYILGHIELEDTLKAVEVTDDTFCNWIYEKEENWEILRTQVNIFLGCYLDEAKETDLKPLAGDIVVKTQYEYLLDKQRKKRPDLKIIGNDKITYIDIQNTVSSHIPIPSAEYLVHAQGKFVTHICFLKKDLPELTEGENFNEYLFKSSESNKKSPYNACSILYVNLEKIAKGTGKAAELATVLLGENMNPKDKDVQDILEKLKINFSYFKNDKGVKDRMTLADKWL